MATSWSLVPSKDLSAELRLAQAISEFQSSLSAKEKIDFQAQKIRFSQGPPTAQDVYRLTAEIDCASEKVSGGRVFGPRFMKFLQAVQQFASLGDVLVGGSQNLIACGVWTGVRFALMVRLKLTRHQYSNHSTGNNCKSQLRVQGIRGFHEYRSICTKIRRTGSHLC